MNNTVIARANQNRFYYYSLCTYKTRVCCPAKCAYEMIISLSVDTTTSSHEKDTKYKRFFIIRIDD